MSVLDPVPFPTLLRAERPERGAIVHRSLDAWLIGGLSLLTFGVMYVSADKGTAASQVTWAAFYLAFLVNGPHFFASYWHLYVDGRHKLRTDSRYVWAAWVVPALLLAGLVVGARVSSPALLGRMVQLMYLSVGWHYVKQTFGVALVSSAAHGRPVSGLSKRTLRINMLNKQVPTHGRFPRPSSCETLRHIVLSIRRRLLKSGRTNSLDIWRCGKGFYFYAPSWR